MRNHRWKLTSALLLLSSTLFAQFSKPDRYSFGVNTAFIRASGFYIELSTGVEYKYVRGYAGVGIRVDNAYTNNGNYYSNELEPDGNGIMLLWGAQGIVNVSNDFKLAIGPRFTFNQGKFSEPYCVRHHSNGATTCTAQIHTFNINRFGCDIDALFRLSDQFTMIVGANTGARRQAHLKGYYIYSRIGDTRWFLDYHCRVGLRFKIM